MSCLFIYFDTVTRLLYKKEYHTTLYVGIVLEVWNNSGIFIFYFQLYKDKIKKKMQIIPRRKQQGKNLKQKHTHKKKDDDNFITHT